MKENTALYRFYDSEHQLLYVGISNNLVSRFGQHSQIAEWHSRVTFSRVEHFETRAEALVAEKKAIQSEHPIFNKVHNFKNESSKKHIARIFDITSQFPDEYHPNLIKEILRLLDDDWIRTQDLEVSKLWALVNALSNLSFSIDNVEVPCQSCMSLINEDFVADAHTQICAAHYYKETK